MKLYIKSTSYEYKGWSIYEDKEKGKTYIYTEPKGKGRLDFPTTKEAEEWIDEKSN